MCARSLTERSHSAVARAAPRCWRSPFRVCRCRRRSARRFMRLKIWRYWMSREPNERFSFSWHRSFWHGDIAIPWSRVYLRIDPYSASSDLAQLRWRWDIKFKNCARPCYGSPLLSGTHPISCRLFLSMQVLLNSGDTTRFPVIGARRRYNTFTFICSSCTGNSDWVESDSTRVHT